MRIIKSVTCLFAIFTISSADDARWLDQDIEQIAYSIADPASSEFRNHLTRDEATELLKRIPEIRYDEGSAKKRDPRNALPHLQRASLIGAARDHALSLKPRDMCGSDDLVTPSCIREIYGIDHVPEPSRVTFGVFATEGASFNADDVTHFLAQYRPEASAATYTVVGTGNPAIATDVEAQFEIALNTQTLIGTAWPAQGILYNLGGVFGPNPGRPYRPFVDFLHELITNETVPGVVSFSQSLSETFVDPTYARTLCLTMALVGARGISLLFSSGNNGPNGETSGAHRAVFEPKFPASCPWVTAVGGTTNMADETAATSTTIPSFQSIFYTASGGGFSNLFARPAYQNVAVPGYIVEHVPTSYYGVSGFNASGRGIPDLSAFSTNMPTSVNGATLPLGGTSSSTPLWAAVIALLNDHEASQGRPALGFLNPWLYTLGSSAEDAPLRDIVTGGNSKGACNALNGCNLTETLGYDVTTSWDPVTGLGSPDFQRLIESLEEAALECS